jgi:hypothetical protein
MTPSIFSVLTSTSTQLPTSADPTSTSTTFLPLAFGTQETVQWEVYLLGLNPFDIVLT